MTTCCTHAEFLFLYSEVSIMHSVLVKCSDVRERHPITHSNLYLCTIYQSSDD